MSPQTLLRMAMAGALACLLSACWMSEKALVGDRDAVAVDIVGTYRSEGEDGPTDMDIVADGPKSYLLISGQREEIPARFVALQSGWYLMEGMGHSDEEGAPPYYLFFIVRPSDHDLRIYSPNCEDVPGKFKGLKREPLAYAAEDDPDASAVCNFGKLDGLKKAAAAYVVRLEKGELPDDPQVFERAAR